MRGVMLPGTSRRGCRLEAIANHRMSCFRRQNDAERIVKPRSSRPEVTSFKPVADAKGLSARIGDGISNLS